MMFRGRKVNVALGVILTLYAVVLIGIAFYHVFLQA